VVRSASPGNATNILLKYELTTFQAYNYWGGGSLYSHSQDSLSLAPTDTIAMDRPLTLISSQSNEYFAQNFMKVLADSGYSMEFCNNIDLDRDSVGFGLNLLSNYKMLVLWNHDEYWSPNERDNAIAFIGIHGNIARFAPNTCYWRVNWDSTTNGVGPHRRLVCLKNNVPWRTTPEDQWRELGEEFHEARFLGSEYETGYNLHAPSDSLLRPDHWIFRNTNLALGDTFGIGYVQNNVRKGIVAGEIDNTKISWPPFPTIDTLAERAVLSSLESGSGYLRHQMIYYEDTASNARVFAQGASGWIDALQIGPGGDSTDRQRIRTITINIISHFSGKKYLGKVYTDPAHAIEWHTNIELDGDTQIPLGKYLRVFSPTTVTVGSGVTFFVDGTLEINVNVNFTGSGNISVGSTGQIVLVNGASLTLNTSMYAADTVTISVPSNTTLRIDSLGKIYFGSGSGISVSGTLTVQGTSANHVVLTRSDGNNDYWSGTLSPVGYGTKMKERGERE
jgi:hypothetical protein